MEAVAAETAEVTEAAEVTPEATRIEQAAEVLEMVAPDGDGAEEAAEVVADSAPDEIDALQEKLESYVAKEMEGEDLDIDTEPEEAPVSRNVGKEYRALRKRKRQVERREREMEERLHEFQAQQEKLEQGLDIIRMLQENPEAAFRKFTEMAGTDADEFYEQLTTQRLSGGEAPEASPAMQAVRRLDAQLREERAAQAREREEMAERRQAHEYERAVEGYVGEVCNIPSHPDLAEKWPNLAALRPDILQARARYAVAWAIDNSPHSTLPEIVDALDGIVAEEYSYTLGRLKGARGSGSPSSEVNPEGLGKPVDSKPKSLTLTNNDAAVTSRHGRELSHSDRVKAAASALPDLAALIGS